MEEDYTALVEHLRAAERLRDEHGRRVLVRLDSYASYRTAELQTLEYESIAETEGDTWAEALADLLDAASRIL